MAKTTSTDQILSSLPTLSIEDVIKIKNEASKIIKEHREAAEKVISLIENIKAD